MLQFWLRWGGSSAGRASRSQCEGREFDPPPLHQRIQGLSRWLGPFHLVDSTYCANFAPLGLPKPWAQHQRSGRWHLSPVEGIFSGRPAFGARATWSKSRRSTLERKPGLARQIESEIDRGVFVSRVEGVEAESTTLIEALGRYTSARSHRARRGRSKKLPSCVLGRTRSSLRGRWRRYVAPTSPSCGTAEFYRAEATP